MSSILLVSPVLLLLLLNVPWGLHPRPACALPPPATVDRDTGDAAYLLGGRLMERDDPEREHPDYARAAEYFYTALLRRQEDSNYALDDVFTWLMHCYRGMGQPEGLYLRIGRDYLKQGDAELARNMGHAALESNPRAAAGHLLLADTYTADMNEMYSSRTDRDKKMNHLRAAEKLAPRDYKVMSDIGNTMWGMNLFDSAAQYFRRAYALNSSYLHGLAFAAYTRSSICDWGPRGQRYDEDMRALVLAVRHEEALRSNTSRGGRETAAGAGSSVVQPHMALGFDMPADLKLAAAASHAAAERRMAEEATGEPAANHSALLPAYRQQFERDPSSFRIRVGYVSANIKSKTTVYMAQDLLRFHDRSRFEVHVYATTPPDTPRFLEVAMRGVDWRRKVAASVEHFHEVQGMDVFQLHKLIRAHGIHILLNWDGYSNNGVRPTGLFAMQPAPIQIAHQEYIGTVGADYIQYMITDPVASPRRYEQFYSEKFIWLPSSFLATSMAYLQPDMQPPSVDPPHPERRGCGGAPASFVYCNFNKQLKFDPHVFREWLQILQSVPDSVLCLLENPRDSIPFIESFVAEFDSSLKSRVRFQEFLLNPFENQRRDAEMCNAVLDTPRYNGHTTAADNLWAGVPVVTFGDGIEMGGRVGASILSTLGMPELIAMGQGEYNRIAVSLGRTEEYYLAVRAKLVATCLEGSNPYWDLRRYMKNLENGLQIAFFSFLNGREPSHIRVADAYDHEGWGVRCAQTADGSCSPVEVEGSRWPWAGPDQLESFYRASESVVARDDAENARITPEPKLNYHGVSDADVEEFTAFTIKGIAVDDSSKQDPSVDTPHTWAMEQPRGSEGRDLPSKKRNRVQRGEKGSRRVRNGEPLSKDPDAVKHSRKKRIRSNGAEREMRIATDEGGSSSKKRSKKRISEKKRKKRRP